MRVLIAGAGRVGLSVGANLLEAGHDVLLVDRDPEVAKRAFELHGLVSLAGDAADAGFLREAEIGRADVVVAMLPRDADNLAVAALALASGVSRVMVRMRDPEFRPIYQRAGVQRILSETDVFVGALATAIEHEPVRHSMILGDGDAVAFELVLPEAAAVAGRTVRDIAADPEFPRSCVFAGMYGDDVPIVAPRGDTVVRAGLTVLLVSRKDEVGMVIEFFLQGRASRLPTEEEGRASR
jgi:trk system potassium uptake protein TrkA